MSVEPTMRMDVDPYAVKFARTAHEVAPRRAYDRDRRQEAWKQLQAIEQQFFSLHELVAQSQDQLRETFALMSQIEHMTQR